MSSLDLNPKQGGKQYWKSLDELAEAPEYKEFLHREFPEGASELGSGVSRRKFLQVMGAGMALAGVTGCKIVRRPEVEILPYNKMPESLIPGLPQFYATAMSLKGEAVGLLVESHEGRPTKIEGNPRHPGSLGGSGTAGGRWPGGGEGCAGRPGSTGAGEGGGWTGRGSCARGLKRGPCP